MILSIVANDGVPDPAGEAAAMKYVSDTLNPLASSATRTIEEALITQVVFFFLIVLIVVIAMVWVCSISMGMPVRDIMAITGILVLLGVLLLVVISYYAISVAREAANSIRQDIESSVTSSVLIGAIESGACAYVQALTP